MLVMKLDENRLDENQYKLTNSLEVKNVIKFF